jgi:hypothetical protein
MWILFASLAVIVAGTYLGFDLRKWFLSAPLRREWKARAVTFRIGSPFGLIPGPNVFLRAPETTIAVSRSPLRIYGIDGRREWIVVRSKQGEREVQLSLTKRFFLDEVWNALVTAGAIPRSDGPARRDRL